MQLRNALASQARPRATSSLPSRSSPRGRSLHVRAAATPQRRSRSPQDKLKKPSSSSASAATTTAVSPTAAVPASSAAAADNGDDDGAALPAAYTVSCYVDANFWGSRAFRRFEREKGNRNDGK